MKSLSTKRWKAQIDSVKVVCYQLPGNVEALSALQTFTMEKKDSMSMANSIQKEPMTWRFVLCVVIWYNVLYQIKHVSKILSLETLKKETKGVQAYLNNSRVSGLAACQTDARGITEALDIDITLPQKRQRKISWHSYMRLQKSLSEDICFCPWLPQPLEASVNDSVNWRIFMP